jgi:hypothetical protein
MYLPIFFWTLSFLRCIGGILLAAKALDMSNIFMFEAEWRTYNQKAALHSVTQTHRNKGWLIKAVLSLGAVEDILVSLVTCYSLMRQAPKHTGR